MEVVRSGAAILLAASAFAVSAARADDAPGAAQNWAVHGQATAIEQGNLAFASPYAGPNSLPSKAEGRETFDLTLFAGARLWRGAEVWLNPEIDQGFGVGNTIGIAGFPSDESLKVGSPTPYFRLQRAFIRQTIDLGGAPLAIEADANQLAGRQLANRVVLWLGRFAVSDVFDNNDYAHDAQHDFLNWGMVDAATFDYAADAWGYTDGLAAELYQGAWTLRLGLFDLSDMPNSERIDTKFDQFQMIAEVEARYGLAGEPGSVRVTTFLSRGRMGRFADAIALADVTGSAPDAALVRRYRSRGGVDLDFQQQLRTGVGLFLRAGFANGDVEPYEFTDVDQTVAGGLSVKGAGWRRPGDTVGVAIEVNGISRTHQAYLAAGGLGLVIGDGRLPHPGDERIVETYYDVPIGRFVHLGADYQFVSNPAYNRDRGPISLFAGRLHVQF